MTPRQIVVNTLNDLKDRCLKEQIHLRTIRAAQATMARDEKATYSRIKGLKARINRELTASAGLLGLSKPPE